MLDQQNIQLPTPWWNECVDEAYAIPPQEATNPTLAPGFDIAQLQADLGEVAT